MRSHTWDARTLPLSWTSQSKEFPPRQYQYLTLETTSVSTWWSLGRPSGDLCLSLHPYHTRWAWGNSETPEKFSFRRSKIESILEDWLRHHRNRNCEYPRRHPPERRKMLPFPRMWPQMPHHAIIHLQLNTWLSMTAWEYRQRPAKGGKGLTRAVLQ